MTRKVLTRNVYDYMKYCRVLQCRHHKKEHVENFCGNCNHHWVRCKTCKAAVSKESNHNSYDQDSDDEEPYDLAGYQKRSTIPEIICKTCTCGLHQQGRSSQDFASGSETEGD